jgi:hypothetical protein
MLNYIILILLKILPSLVVVVDQHLSGSKVALAFAVLGFSAFALSIVARCLT